MKEGGGKRCALPTRSRSSPRRRAGSAAPPPTSWRAKGRSSSQSTATRAGSTTSSPRCGQEAAALMQNAADVLDPAQVDAVAASVAQEFGAIDILVNAVGGSTIIPHPGADNGSAELRRLAAADCFQPRRHVSLRCHAVAPIMKRQRRGKIVNLSSIAGRGLSGSSSAAYAAAKGGIIAFTRKIAFELGPWGINVNAIAPSRTLTERIRPRWEQQMPRGPGRRNRKDAIAAHRRGARSGQGDLLSRLERRRLRPPASQST